MVAALGLSQIKKVEKIIDIRREKAHYYNKLLGSSQVRIPTEPEGCRHVYQIYSVRAKQRDKLSKDLAAAGVMSRVYFPPIHLTPFYRQKFGYKGGELSVTEKVSSEILALPIYPAMTRDEIDYVCKQVVESYES
jgi:dTDP-4-amino-4,6-dideoxygalactose transaminase